MNDLTQPTKPEESITFVINTPTYSGVLLIFTLLAIGYMLCYYTAVRIVEVPVEVEKPVYVLEGNFTCVKICEMPFGQATGCENCRVECTSPSLFGGCVMNNGWIYQSD